jgi:hypothetical protein
MEDSAAPPGFAREENFKVNSSDMEEEVEQYARWYSDASMRMPMMNSIDARMNRSMFLDDDEQIKSTNAGFKRFENFAVMGSTIIEELSDDDECDNNLDEFKDALEGNMNFNDDSVPEVGESLAKYKDNPIFGSAKEIIDDISIDSFAELKTAKQINMTSERDADIAKQTNEENGIDYADVVSVDDEDETLQQQSSVGVSAPTHSNADATTANPNIENDFEFADVVSEVDEDDTLQEHSSVELNSNDGDCALNIPNIAASLRVFDNRIATYSVMVTRGLRSTIINTDNEDNLVIRTFQSRSLLKCFYMAKQLQKILSCITGREDFSARYRSCNSLNVNY